MADTKITALAAIATVDPAADVLPIVDISDTSMAASGTTKKVTSNQILGAGGTATLASATITGDLTVDTNVLKVDSTLNKVGIGVATLTGLSTLNVAGDIALTSDLVVKNSGGTVQGYIFGSSGLNYRVVASNPHVWQEGGTEQMRLNTTGNLVLKGGTTGANGVGLTFPATQVASSDANCLDDYEEGTWVGTLKGATTDPTIAVTATGRYTKVGRLVSLQISFNNVITTGASGDAYISGSPFTNTNITVHGSAASYLALTFSGNLGSEIDSGGTNISLFDIRSNSAWTSAQHNAGVSRYINAEITYTV